jgi:serine/threonine protein kinase
MEYADGESLESYLKLKKSFLSEEEILRIGSQIATGLAYIHSK